MAKDIRRSPDRRLAEIEEWWLAIGEVGLDFDCGL
jgi:hypothetical protein